MQRAKGELISFPNRDGLKLDGILYSPGSPETIIVHVHGSLGNFYQNYFIRVMARAYLEAGLGLLSFNLSGHDGIAEGYRDGAFEYIGGSLMEFGDCLADIHGAIGFASEYGQRVILQGHSLGCDRVLHYMLTSGSIHDFVLLSPCDSYRLQCNRIHPQTVEEQIQRLKNDTELGWGDLVGAAEYGVSQQGDEYAIPITKRALLSVLESSAYRLIRLDLGMRFRIASRCFIYVGGQDPLQTWECGRMFGHFEDRTLGVKRLFVARGDHDLSPCEAEVSEAIVAWIETL